MPDEPRPDKVGHDQYGNNAGQNLQYSAQSNVPRVGWIEDPVRAYRHERVSAQKKAVGKNRAPGHVHAEKNVNEHETQKKHTILFVIPHQPYTDESSNDCADNSGDRPLSDRSDVLGWR